jgi:MFS family permease
MIGVLFFAIGIPVSAVIADRIGHLRMLMIASALIVVFGLGFGSLLGGGGTFFALAALIVGLLMTGLTYGPLGSGLAELFPTAVRYTGASLTFNLAGILGASLTPYMATWLASQYGLPSVGWYLSAAAMMSLLALAGVAKISGQR